MSARLNQLKDWLAYNGGLSQFHTNLTTLSFTGWEKKRYPTHKQGVLLRIDLNGMFHPVVNVYNIPGAPVEAPKSVFNVNINGTIRQMVLEQCAALNAQPDLCPMDAAMRNVVVRIGPEALFLDTSQHEAEIVPAWQPDMRENTPMSEKIRIKGIQVVELPKNAPSVTDLRCFVAGSTNPAWTVPAIKEGPIRFSGKNFEDVYALFEFITRSPGLMGAYESKGGIPENYLQGRMDALAVELGLMADYRNEQFKDDEIDEIIWESMYSPEFGLMKKFIVNSEDEGC